MKIVIDLDPANGRRGVRLFAAVAVAAIIALPVLATAGPVGSLVSFSAGQPIKAADFNQNFQALKTANDDNDARIGNLSGLSTTAKTNLVAAVNEVFTKAGTGTGATGPQGPQGPAGTSGVLQIALSATTASGTLGNNLNHWTAGTSLASSLNGPFPVSQVASKPYSASLRVQTSNPTTASPGAPGNPLAGGNLVVDLEWNFYIGSEVKSVVQTNVATLAITAAQVNDVTANWTGTVPAAPTATSNFKTVQLGQANSFTVRALVNGTTTAQGESVSGLSITITP